MNMTRINTSHDAESISVWQQMAHYLYF